MCGEEREQCSLFCMNFSHKHIETLLAEHKLEPKRGDKEWEAYFGYVKEIDQILKRKGLRYAN